MATNLIDLMKVNMETFEALFPSEKPTPKARENEKAVGSEKVEDEFEIRRKLFLGK
jgi:hypothetical protein